MQRRALNLFGLCAHALGLLILFIRAPDNANGVAKLPLVVLQ